MYAKLDQSKLVDVRIVANKLADSPKDALLYISGYVEGCRDVVERQGANIELRRGDPPPVVQSSA